MSSIEQKKSRVIDKASEIFLERGISGLTMNEIADECGIGVATLYRYYPQKKNLVIACAANMWNERFKYINSVYVNNMPQNGFEQFKAMGNYLPWMVINDTPFWVFLYRFDAYRTNENLTRVEMKEYDDALKEIYAIFLATYNKGLADNSIREIDDFPNFYIAFTQAVLALSSKLLSRIDGAAKDDKYAKKINFLLDMLSMYLDNRNVIEDHAPKF